MRGIVMEVNEKSLFLLTHDGEIREIRKPKEEVRIGHEYNSKNYMFSMGYSFVMQRRVVAVLLILLMMLPTSLSYTYFKPYGYINVDINPSIEIAYNIFDRVIGVKSINEDGIKMIEDDLNIRNMKTNEALQNIISKAEKLGYIPQNKENIVLITVSSKDQYDVLKYEDKDLLGENYKIKIISANEDEHKEASKRGVSTAEIALINKINEENNDDEKNELIKIYGKFNEEIEDDSSENEQTKENKNDFFEEERDLEKSEKLDNSKELRENIDKELKVEERIENRKEEKEEREIERLKKEDEIKKLNEEKRKDIEEKRQEDLKRQEENKIEQEIKRNKEINKIEDKKIEDKKNEEEKIDDTRNEQKSNNSEKQKDNIDKEKEKEKNNKEEGGGY